MDNILTNKKKEGNDSGLEILFLNWGTIPCCGRQCQHLSGFLQEWVWVENCLKPEEFQVADWWAHLSSSQSGNQEGVTRGVSLILSWVEGVEFQTWGRP